MTLLSRLGARTKEGLILLLIAGLVRPSPLNAAPLATADAQMDRMVEEALTALYNLDYARSKKTFQDLDSLYPDHPMGSYGVVTALWWELTNEYDEKNDGLEREFFAASEGTIQKTKKLIKQGDPSGVARLCLGGTLGLKARWEAIQGHWMAAYRNGKNAFDLQKAAIRVNPELYDAYLGPGIFHYYVAVLPAAVKVFARMVFGGSKAQGLEEIRLAMTKGRFSRTAALLFLVNIYTNNEKDPHAALALLQEARKEFPESPFFQLVELLILEEAQEWDALEKGALDFLSRVEASQRYYTPRLTHRGFYSLANSYQGRGDWTQALDLYHRILTDYPLEDRWISLTYLNRGKTHDLLGERDKALADYRTVLKRRDVWGLHDQAKALIRRPYEPPGRPTDKS